MNAQQIKLSDLHLNSGQLPGVPKNPRFIKDDRYAKLLQSIKDDPEMLELRELIAVEHDGKYVVIAGNMRLRALRELGFVETPVKVLPADTDAKKLRAYATKDNVPFGAWDWEVAANEWDADELNEWGAEILMWNAANQLTEDDLDFDEDFDPIGSASNLHKVTFIFDGEEEAESYLKSLNVDIKKAGQQWTVNLSTQFS